MDDNIPDIAECPVVGSHQVEQGVVNQRSLIIGKKITKGILSASENFSIF